MEFNLLNNRYKVLRVLGEGGFGQTFLAEDTQMPSRRQCVIKQLKPVTTNPQVEQIVQERFQREAAILETLGRGHPQIPELFAYFKENNQYYLVQEWVDGKTLSEKMMTEGLFSEATAAKMLQEILPVLNFMHGQGIVHRDIKPENIIIRRIDDKPVLIDFGAVRETMGTMVNSQGQTTSSIVIGTPGFMSSEQAAGRPVFSSDLYSLGLTLVYLTTGKMPQDLPTDPNTAEIVWRNYAPGLSPRFGQILDKSIQYHPRDRYHSAAEMLGDLQAGISESTVVSGGIAPTIAPASPYSGGVPPTIQQPPSPYPQQPPSPYPQQPQSPYPQQPPTPVPYQQPSSPYPQQPQSPYPQQPPSPYPQAQGTPPPYVPPTDQQTYQASTPPSSGGFPKLLMFIGAALVVAIGGGMWLARSGDDNSISTVTPASPSPTFTPIQSSPDPVNSPNPASNPSPDPAGAGPSTDTTTATTPNVSTADNYGAIARSPTSGYKGFSWNYSSRDGAEERALNECSSTSGSTDCEVLVWFRNACGAIAESDDGGAGTGWGVNEELAQQYAIESCEGIGSGCEVTRTICSGTE
ncbi:serine/threonine protein kinase [Thalassoporum mexicanum PCC 7367]|uniref:protein kinase domain-containing protein n=1 Tax=Thalassoporum mexicanum TaxID=3457544 RepID=UPI00029FF6A1|nr:DUF4189 domain-containing protein [Pseudanabaena sp. PCC 7367]AFY71261.1 serine/threonine protein kinase [Pseudanabaena sp. PCC 7367]